ncbi:MAG TPA: hypothetical protein PLV83_04215 [Bacilli bacterium]|nr:hypothetical protein [Bacilli bacterium]
MKIKSNQKTSTKVLKINQSCLNCFNEKCQISKHERFAIDENNNINGYNCLAWKDEVKVKTLRKK